MAGTRLTIRRAVMTISQTRYRAHWYWPLAAVAWKFGAALTLLPVMLVIFRWETCGRRQWVFCFAGKLSGIACKRPRKAADDLGALLGADTGRPPNRVLSLPNEIAGPSVRVEAALVVEALFPILKTYAIASIAVA